MQNVEWVMGEWVIPLRLLRLLDRAPCGANKLSHYHLRKKLFLIQPGPLHMTGVQKIVKDYFPLYFDVIDTNGGL